MLNVYGYTWWRGRLVQTASITKDISVCTSTTLLNLSLAFIAIFYLSKAFLRMGFCFFAVRPAFLWVYKCKGKEGDVPWLWSSLIFPISKTFNCHSAQGFKTISLVPVFHYMINSTTNMHSIQYPTSSSAYFFFGRFRDADATTETGFQRVYYSRILICL